MKNKMYRLVKIKKGTDKLTWQELIIAEFSLPDKDGHYMRCRTYADFGNATNKDNIKNASFILSLLRLLAENEEK